MAYPRARRNPQATYDWRGDTLRRRTPTFQRSWASANAPIGSGTTLTAAHGAGRWSYGDPVAIGTRGQGGMMDYGASPSQADLAAANVSGNAYSVGGTLSRDALQKKYADEYETAYQEAKTSNVARYEDILGQYESLPDYRLGAIEQDLVSRGLAGTSSLGSARRSSAADMLQRKLNFMERRTDRYPDPQHYAALMQMHGEWGRQPGGATGGGTPIGQDFSGPLQTYAQPRYTPTKQRRYYT